MTLKELENIIALRGEIAQLTRDMKKHYAKGDFVGDVGKRYVNGNPVTYMIQGNAPFDAPALERLKEKCKKRVAELEAKVAEAERFIDDIPDTNVRVLVREYIVNGATWEQAAKVVYKKMSADSARKCVKAYFESAIL